MTRSAHPRKCYKTNHWRAVSRRYHRLVNKDFKEGLTEAEQQKQKRLMHELDRLERPAWVASNERMNRIAGVLDLLKSLLESDAMEADPAGCVEMIRNAVTE